ncbi:ABC transporter permease, partial [Burkholderia cenocepacia]|nr:ABC transporter permease [Burkholderia cenocepacia]
MKPVTSSSAVRQAASVERSSRRGPARIRDALERTGILLVLAVLVVVFALREPAFLNLDNLFSILQAVSIVALLGIGVTVTLAAGGFGLSVGDVAPT